MRKEWERALLFRCLIISVLAGQMLLVVMGTLLSSMALVVIVMILLAAVSWVLVAVEIVGESSLFVVNTALLCRASIVISA